MKLFKTLLISLFLISNIFTQDISGNFKLSGLSAVYYDFVRQEGSVIITDNYGFNHSTIGDTYFQGEAIRSDYQFPTPEAYLNSAGVQLYVNFYDDGSAAIAQGSTYPTSITEDCISTLSTLPITGDQGYSSNLNSGATIPLVDIVGLPSKSIYAGQNSGSCSITSSPVFDVFPQNPAELTIPFPINTASISEELGELLPANTILPGQTAGYALFDNKLVSTIEQNAGTRPSLYLEWHAMDGPVSDSGLGDIIGEDEDGDGTDYDSIYGLETIRVTKIIAGQDCGAFDYPIAGQHISGLQSIKEQQCIDGNLDSDCTSYAENWISDCINDSYTTATGNDVENLYAFDSNPISSLWGGIVTWNSVNNIGIDDSNIDFDESCIIDGDDSDCSGRLTFSYIPQCLPSFSIRHFMVELTELCEASEQDVCGVCGGDGPVTWYNDADRDGLGDPNNFKINCLPGYCIEDESLSYTECNDVNNSWDWLSMGICSDGNGNELSNPTALGDFEFCNSIIENYPQYNATWLWDKSFSTNNYDNDDTNSECPEGQEPDCLGICGGSLLEDDCNVCDGDNSSCTGCMDDTACNYSLNATISGECEYSEVNYDCSGNCNVEVDCAGVCGGSAALDDCTVPVCSGGSTGFIANDFCTDCNDIVNGIAFIDPLTNDCVDPLLDISIDEIIPNDFIINRIYPNPFNPSVIISYASPISQYIEGSIFDISGKRIKTLISKHHGAGTYSIKWNATGKPSGIYIFILKTDSEVKSQKLVLLK